MTRGACTPRIATRNKPFIGLSKPSDQKKEITLSSIESTSAAPAAHQDPLSLAVSEIPPGMRISLDIGRGGIVADLFDADRNQIASFDEGDGQAASIIASAMDAARNHAQADAAMAFVMPEQDAFNAAVRSIQEILHPGMDVTIEVHAGGWSMMTTLSTEVTWATNQAQGAGTLDALNQAIQHLKHQSGIKPK